MADNPTTAANLIAEFTDVLSEELLLAPDPELVFAKHAYSAAMAEEMAAADPGSFDVFSAQMAAMASTKVGAAANLQQAMSGGGEGSLVLSMDMAFPALVTMVKEAKGPGDTIKINRPKLLDDVVSDNRWLTNKSRVFGNSQPLGMDQATVTIAESSGPGDAAGNTVPISISLFAQERARHDQLTNAKLQLRRSRWRWVHYQIQNRLMAVTNITRPQGVASDAAFTGVDNEPLAYEMLPRIEAKMQKRNIPGIAGTPLYVLYLPSDGISQLKRDPAYQRQAEYHEAFNVLFPGYVKTVGNLILCMCNTLPTVLGGAGGTIPVMQGVCTAPGILGWGLGKDATLLRDKNDDGGRFFNAAWNAFEGYTTLNSDFAEVIHFT